MKLYIEGFRGPWGWVPEYERVSKFEISTAEDADVIFQCDPANWKQNEKYLGKKFVIANVLDFAQWVGGNPETEEYVEKFCKRANLVTGISKDVIDRLHERGITAKMFYYPSQVDHKTIKWFTDVPKKKRIISFCRLGDPGKMIKEAVGAFVDSKAFYEGWEYSLVGPEAPNFPLPIDVRYHGYVDRTQLYGMVASSSLTLMPSMGEGLGLPAIESILMGTIPIVRNIEPMITTLGGSAIFFIDNDDLTEMLKVVNTQGPFTLLRDHVSPWIRDNAFDTFESMIECAYED